MVKKKIHVAAFVLLLPLFALSQQDVKVNISNAILYEFNMSYEYVVNDYFTISGFGGYSYGFPDVSEESKYYYLGPEFRYYVAPKNGGDRFFLGFYSRFKSGYVDGTVQESGTLISQGGSTTLYTRGRQDYNKLAIGFMLGSKWVMRNGFVFGFFAGFGRNLVSNYSEFDPHRSLFVPSTYTNEFSTSTADSEYWDFRIGFNVGYRFGK